MIVCLIAEKMEEKKERKLTVEFYIFLVFLIVFLVAEKMEKKEDGKKKSLNFIWFYDPRFGN